MEFSKISASHVLMKIVDIAVMIIQNVLHVNTSMHLSTISANIWENTALIFHIIIKDAKSVKMAIVEF